MKQFFSCILTGLMLLAPTSMAIQLSDLSPSINRSEADENLTKDYAYRIMSDMSIRRIWNLDQNRKLTVDFDGKTGELICIALDYRKPVALEDADQDAAEIGKFDDAKWRKFSADKAAKYFMSRARAMKFDEGYMFQELSAANKCQRLTFYTKIPKENRRLLTEGDTSSATTALGSSISGNAIKALLEDEEKRLYTANKTDKAAAAPKKVKKEEPKPEPVVEVEEPEEEPEPVVEEPKETGKIVKAPVEVKPIKTVTQKGDRTSDFQKLLAKLGLDKLETMHWVIGGVGLFLLLTIIGAIRRNSARRAIEERAAKLRRNTASVQASLRHSVRKNSADKSKLRIR